MSDGLKKTLAGAVAVVLVGYVIYSVWGSFGDSPVMDQANARTLMDSETGELFRVTLDENSGPYPHKNPKTGTATLWPTEVCYARECGKKKDGTHVILNKYLGKPEPTFCPECGALVRMFNPGRPKEGQ